MVTGKTEDQNYYIGELGGQLGFMCAIATIEYILGSTTLVVNSCNNISALRRAIIHQEAVQPRLKQVDLISCLSDVYQSIDSGMYLVHVYVHHNSGKTVSILTLLASLNVRMDALAEHIMAPFIILPETRNTTAIGLLAHFRLPSVSIHRSPIHSNLAQYIP